MPSLSSPSLHCGVLFPAILIPDPEELPEPDPELVLPDPEELEDELPELLDPPLEVEELLEPPELEPDPVLDDEPPDPDELPVPPELVDPELPETFLRFVKSYSTAIFLSYVFASFGFFQQDLSCESFPFLPSLSLPSPHCGTNLPAIFPLLLEPNPELDPPLDVEELDDPPELDAPPELDVPPELDPNPPVFVASFTVVLPLFPIIPTFKFLSFELPRSGTKLFCKPVMDLVNTPPPPLKNKK